jgi:hypothetical protein
MGSSRSREFFHVRCSNPACRRAIKITVDMVGLDIVCRDCGRKFKAIPTVEDNIPIAEGFSPPTSFGDHDAPLDNRDAEPDSGLPNRIGRFQIKAWLGKGGFGRVYRAYDPHLEREVALKVPLAGSLNTPKRKERFLGDARSGSRASSRKFSRQGCFPLFQAFSKRTQTSSTRFNMSGGKPALLWRFQSVMPRCYLFLRMENRPQERDFSLDATIHPVRTHWD